MKKIVTILVLLAAAGGGAYYYYTYGKAPEKPTVVQTTVSQGDILEQVQATGTLEALRTVTVGPQVSGTINSLEGVDYNTIVKKGQVVAKLDPQLLQVQVDIQQAAIERQQTDIESQKVQLADAQRTQKRTQELFDKGLIGQADLDAANLNIKTRQAAIDSAQKQLVQAEANLSQAKLNVSYTEVKSPIDGVVVERRVDIGQTVQSSMNITPFFIIATDLKNLKLTAGVDEADIGKIQPGMAVNFTVDSYQGQTFHGTVNAVRLNATNVNNVVTYPVWIDAPNPDLKLRPSMTATVRIQIATASNVIRIPNQALRFRPTADTYTALGLTPPPPAAGRGQGAGEGRRNRQDGAAAQAPAGATAATPGATPGAATGRRQQAAGQTAQNAPNAAAGAAGRGAAAGAAGGQGQGQGRGGRFANLSPEERQRMMAEFAARGGRTGQRGGRGTAPAPVATSADDYKGSTKIDDFFEPAPVRNSVGTVYTWDEANKKLTETRVVTSLTDGTFSQLVNGDVKVGQQLVTSIIVPQTAAQRNQNSLFGGNQGRGNFGGMQPGNGPGGPGGGAPGGGGGNRGGGGGGGGR